MLAASRPLPRFWSLFSTVGNAALRFAASVSKQAVAWFIPMALTAAVTAYVSYVYNQKANTVLVIQQQRLADLQQFRLSGAGLDQGLSAMSDALVDGKGLDQARRDMRAAITKNISDAVAVRHLLGPKADSYIAGLANLREVVDAVGTMDSGQGLWQTSLNLMKERRDLIASAERQALEA
jgi:hypothetical protein